ncbi:MAG TPA: glycerophosphodiester phosphodiesterase [Gemmatimonadaceae bacterium]|nr:glycerophosphodiester phosphodiesterase [Gemmatimonadaceae bacterium]
MIGHRGNSAHAPENTLESFRQAISLGVDALEFDVRVTRDGEVVVFHDATVTRTTGARGAVAEMTLDELRALDAGATFTTDGGQSHPYRGRGVGISTLEEVLRALPDTPVLIEIKVPEASPGTRAVIERLGAEERCIVASFKADRMLPFEGSRIARGACTREIAARYLPAVLGRRFGRLPFQVMSLPEVHDGIPVPLGALARAARPAGVPLHVWTVNDAATARALWDKGVCGILSDDPAVILEARDRWLTARRP